MRFATILLDERPSLALVRGDDVLPLNVSGGGAETTRDLAGGGEAMLEHVREWVSRQPVDAYRPIEGVTLGPAVPDPGAIFTVGLNYSSGTGADAARPQRPLVYAKLPTAVAGQGSNLSWDRTLTANVDPESELGVVIGATAVDVAPETAMEHVFGYTCINDISSRDAWLDGDQWLLGKSFAGFCPVGPWVVTADEIGSGPLRLGCTINGLPIQDGDTSQMIFPIPEVISYLSRHVALRPGDLIATGTPARLSDPPGPDRHLEAGDVVTVWVEGIGKLTTTIS